MSDSFVLANELPALSQQDLSTVAFYVAEEGKAWVVYEGLRDFLSAPRAFIVLSVKLSEPLLMSTGGQDLDSQEWNQLQELDYGVYRLSGSVLCENPKSSHWLCYTPNIILAFCAEDVSYEQSVYHQSSAHAVLAQLISHDCS